jgi:hypothetical protein
MGVMKTGVQPLGRRYKWPKPFWGSAGAMLILSAEATRRETQKTD